MKEATLQRLRIALKLVNQYPTKGDDDESKREV
jgi:hypothetical protein